ncbi:MAG: hypothetical protein ACREOI_18155 [bacterium]
MNNELQEIIEDLHAAENKCQQFEKQYGLLSEYFFDAYSNGWLDDDGHLDFAEWAGYFKSKQDRLRRYRAFMLKESSVIRNLNKIQFDETIA